MSKTNLYPNIRAELKRAGLTVDQMAAHMCLTRQSVYNKLNGKCSISLQDMRDIQAFFKDKDCGAFSLDYLFEK